MVQELGKIAVIYKDYMPSFDVSGPAEPATGLDVRFIPELKLAQSPAPVMPDVDLVIYQWAETPQLTREQLQTVFPAAAIVTCSAQPAEPLEARSRAEGYRAHLTEPIACVDLCQLYNPYPPSPRPSQGTLCDLGFARGILDEFFSTFINLVEVSSNKEEFALVFGDLTKKIARRLRAERCLFYLYSEADSHFYPAFTVQTDDNQNRMDFYFNTAVLEEVVSAGVAYVDNSFEGKMADGPHRMIAVHSVLCYPLIKNNKRIGVLEVINKRDPGGFDSSDEEFLACLVHTLTVIVDNAILFQDIERLCYTDDLTKLYNSRYLKQFLMTEVKRTLRYKKKVSVLFMDIDGFKAVNDVYGHLVGSETLVEIGRVLKAVVRDTDVVARYGGDEFVIVLPETSTDSAWDVAERIREKIEHYRFGVKQNLKIDLTVSIGVATCSEHAMTAEGLIQKADTAMYQAKASKNAIRKAV